MPSKESNGFNAKCKTCPSTLSVQHWATMCSNTFFIVTMLNYVLTNNALSGFISRSVVYASLYSRLYTSSFLLGCAISQKNYRNVCDNLDWVNHFSDDLNKVSWDLLALSLSQQATACNCMQQQVLDDNSQVTAVWLVTWGGVQIHQGKF